ncbi:hatching enzyme-like protein, partial [Leptotrombidium deliense]
MLPLYFGLYRLIVTNNTAMARDSKLKSVNKYGNLGMLRYEDESDMEEFVVYEVWQSMNLSWFCDTNPKTVNFSETIRIIDASFDLWQTVIPLKFERTWNRKTANFRLTFVKYDHSISPGDRNFQEEVVGHAFPPPSGEVHLNNELEYANETHRGVDLFTVITHEIGHALGLSHNSNPNSVMYPLYISGISETGYKFTSEEMSAILRLYGNINDKKTLQSSTDEKTKTSDSESGHSIFEEKTPDRHSTECACDESKELKMIDVCKEKIDFITSINEQLLIFRNRSIYVWSPPYLSPLALERHIFYHIPKTQRVRTFIEVKGHNVVFYGKWMLILKSMITVVTRINIGVYGISNIAGVVYINETLFLFGHRKYT